MIHTTGWDRGLSVAATGRGLIGHAGAVLLRRCADRTGLTGALERVLPHGRAANFLGRGAVLVQLAVALVLGATNISEAEALLAHQATVFGPAASDSTTRRLLEGMDEAALIRIGKIRARVRRHVWGLLHLRPGGFPWLVVAGKRLTGWIVIDLDATIITAASKKQGAAATFKKTHGFHPLAAWCANTTESLAMLLREGNAGANTASDHIRVLSQALAQIPHSSAAKILVRVDGARATHELLTHLEALNTARRTVRYTVGWRIDGADERAIGQLPEAAWETSLHQDGTVQESYAVAELTALNTREGWPESMRLIVRRVKPSRRQIKNLTAFEIRTGWRYSITATNIRRMGGVPGSQHAQWLDVLHRSHAVVEDRVRCDKARGLRNLPSQSWTVNRAWMLTANLARAVARSDFRCECAGHRRCRRDRAGRCAARGPVVDARRRSNRPSCAGSSWRLTSMWPCSAALTGTDVGGVLTEGHVPHIMDPVLDAPLGLHDLCDALRVGLAGGQVGDHAHGLPAAFPGRPHGAVARDAGDLTRVGGSPVRGSHLHHPRIDTAVSAQCGAEAGPHVLPGHLPARLPQFGRVALDRAHRTPPPAPWRTRAGCATRPRPPPRPPGQRRPAARRSR